MLRSRELLDRIRSIPFQDRDAWIDEHLGFEVPPADIDLPRGSVPYLPSGVDEIIAMVLEAPLGPDDEFVDLGSGVGRVAILAHLLTGARACGIEIQAHLVRSARAHCERLQLAGVTFVEANAADPAVALDGSIFYLYAPFNGDMLAAVLRRLEEVAGRRPIIVGAVDLEFHDVPWLRARKTSCASLTLYDSQGDA